MEDQLTFDEHKLARRDDPDTSKAAAQRIKAGSMRGKLLDAFTVAPWTAEEAADWCGFTASDGAWKRVSDLLNLGLLYDTGLRRTSRSGREQRVLSLTVKGLQAFVDITPQGV
jgi:hypothetical protein